MSSKKKEKPQATIDIVENGSVKGVRVQCNGEDFVIMLRDLDNDKKDFSHNTAVKRLAELNLDTFSHKQAKIVCALYDEINLTIKQAGGKPFNGWYTTKEAPDGYYTWYFGGDAELYCDNSKYDGIFKCRPAVNYNVFNK